MRRPRFNVAALTAAVVSLVIAPSESGAQKKQRDRITRQEILDSPHRDLDLFQVIRSLRPHFLEPPPGVATLGGAYGRAQVAVFVDAVRETGIAALRTLSATHVEEVRYLDATRAENEFGPRANGGALVIKLYRPPKAVQPPPARDSTQPPPR
jgi:hypothetical protein